ncbi:MAG: histidine phosphatase family protein [Algibacter sp.]|uniref:SixA phosphatase family protein n=1 Tax=Algibacter sp. TaxID=1872428 RepID=UPI002619710F|nr:histidine phosphatase family protein [Algibacter sp.]MDG1728669.1 histidine phosphatase family protein [Algibacter sp.]MDG2177313.1 histidine phosphatase family protein [Algibacter sp.]
MKKLILVRHAKSSWEYDVKDHQRPLKDRGYIDANLVSNTMKSVGFIVDSVISSDAVRTKTTAEIFISNLEIEENIVEFNYNLYDFAGTDLLKVITSCDDSINTLMIFGHNNALTAFVNTYGDTYIDNVPTSGMVAIEFDIDKWSKLKPGKTYKTIFPRDLKD